jgi:hypothetical protein
MVHERFDTYTLEIRKQFSRDLEKCPEGPIPQIVNRHCLDNIDNTHELLAFSHAPDLRFFFGKIPSSLLVPHVQQGLRVPIDLCQKSARLGLGQLKWRNLSLKMKDTPNKNNQK